MKHLVVLIDFSPYTPTLINLAYEWKKFYKFSLKFIYKIPGLAPTLSGSPGKNQIIAFEIKEAGKKFSGFLSELGLEKGDADFIATEKQLPRFLAEQTGADDILLLGLKGTGFLKKILVGSTATEIINQLSRLIIALPKSIEEAVPKKLVLACHVKYPFNEKALFLLLETVGFSVSEIELMSILSDKTDKAATETYLHHLKDKLSGTYDCTIKLYENVGVFETIKNRYKKFPDDFIVLQKGSRTLNDQLFRKFFINDLVHDGDTPLIILPCEEE